ncbi:MAG: carbohydrate ABC transporter permease [Deinococcota bacterium]
MRHFRKHLVTFLAYVLAIVISVLYLIPFYIMLRNAFMTQREIAAFDWLVWAKEMQWQNIPALFNDPVAPMGVGLWNSTLVSVLQVTGQLVVCSMAAYGLVRIRVKAAQLIFYLILGSLMVPSAAIFVQSFLVVSYLGWVNSLQGLVVPGIFSAFTIFIFRQFFLDFPHDLEDAARVDGLEHLGIFWRIVVPNSVGVFVSLGVLALIRSWNAFLWPLVVGQSKDTWTVQVVLSTFLTAQTINLPALFMASVISVLPIVLLFFVVQRFIVEGVKLSGVKG